MIEESPCVLVNEQERKTLGQIAMRAINAINYHNTGTIEFLMDKDHHFYFLAILNNPKFLAGTASTTFLEDSFLPQWKKELTA